MGLINKVVAFFRNLLGGGPTIEPVKVTSKEAKEINSLKNEIEELKKEKDRIQEQLQQMDTDFMYGKITPEERDKNYVQFMVQAMKLNREITNKKQRIFALGGVITEI
jgi:predicted RNase H-like nuclease (RuvC/YqgF family)